MDKKLKTTAIVLPMLMGGYVATRQKYTIPDFSIFIPNHKLLDFSGDESKDKGNIVQKIFDTIDITPTTNPSIGFIISFDPMKGIQIPVRMWVPWDFPIIYPQVKSQMRENIRIEKKTMGSILMGYNVYVKNVSFYA